MTTAMRSGAMTTTGSRDVGNSRGGASHIQTPATLQKQPQQYTLHRVTSLYDVYPLTASRSSYDHAPSITRTYSQHEYDMAPHATSVHDDVFHTSPSVGALFTINSAADGGGGSVDNQASDHRSVSLCSTFGRFHGEVYETKERSKVLSVLKRRGKTPGASVDAKTAVAHKSAPAKFTADDVVRAGTLTKEGSWRRNWKTRFFILRRDFPSLCYYTSEDKLELLGEIPILPDTIVLDRSAGGHAPYRFQIRTDAKTLLLEAESRDTQRRWVDSCQELVDLVRADKFRSSATALTRTSLMDRDSSDSRMSSLASASVSAAVARRSSVSKASGSASVPSTSTLAPAPLGHSVPSVFSVDAVEYVAPSVTSPTSGAPTRGGGGSGGNESNPLFTSSSRGFFEDPNMNWEKLLEASSSSSWNDESEAESDSAELLLTTSQSTLTASGALEPMAEDQVVDSALHAGRSRSASSKITIVSRSPATLVRHQRHLYDISIEVTLGRRSKLLRSDAASDRTGCFMRISGYLKQTKDLVDIGSTDAIKVSTLLTASERSRSVPFTVIVSAELAQFAQLRFTLYKCSLNQSPGTAQACLGVGRCHVTNNFLSSIPKTISLLEKTSARESLQDALTTPKVPPHTPLEPVASPVVAPEEVVAQTSRGGAPMSFAPPQDGIQIAITAFPSLEPQQILPTTGIDMAGAKYLIPTALTVADDALDVLTQRTPLTRQNSTRVLTDNSSFIASSDAGSSTSGVRFIAVDEILRVPRSTFALPLAYLDYVEEEVLERSRRLRKVLASRHCASHAQVALVEMELEHCRKKTEEYMKQRQFLMRQEKRLLDEQVDGRIADAVRMLKKVAAKDKSKDKDKDKDTSGDVVAPFKRSTYKSLDGWQFLPTNMQDQFLCAYQPGGAVPLVWHTMTMGCPAAHTKGFANGGYPHADMKPSEYNSTTAVTATGSDSRYGGSNPATSPVGDTFFDEPCTSPMGGPSAAASTQTEKTRRKSRVSTTKGPHHVGDESLASLKTRLELKDRLDIIGSQILSAAVACIIATLDLAAVGSLAHCAQLENALKFGYLMNFESLLSTQGKEVGMLEDFAAGAKWLRNVFVSFRKHKTTGEHFAIKNYSPADRRAFAPSSNENNALDANGDGATAGAMQSRSGHYLLVTIGVQERHWSVLPPLLVSGKPFRLRCVLFTQGVNEKQSLVHAYKANSVKVQERINRDNLEELKDLYAIFRRLHAHEGDGGANGAPDRRRVSSVGGGNASARRYSLSALDELLAQIEHHICSPSNQFKKNVALLMDSSDFCRELGASRVTCCKSGKDRTAMSVTLEQARICMSELRATQSATLCATMRLYGVRRKNVFLNTKADKFAFNEVQRKMLPECYKPPPGTYKSGKT